MSNGDRNDLIADVADAVTLDHDVQWDRCVALAAPADGEKLDNLQLISRVLRSRRRVGQTSDIRPAKSSEPHRGGFVRRVIQALMVIATVEVAVAMILLPWEWSDLRRQHGGVAVFLVTGLVWNGASGCLLLLAGRGDSRTSLLGLYFLLNATLSSFHLLLVFLGQLPPPQIVEPFLWDLPTATRLVGILYVPVFLFSPAVLWAFARECPRVHRRTKLDEFARRMVSVSIAIGVAIWVAYAATLWFTQAEYVGMPVVQVFDGSLFIMDLLDFAAVVVIALRAHKAPADEVRRVVVFSAGFLVYLGILVVGTAAELFSPGPWVANFRWSPFLFVVVLMRFPGMILLWYSVLAVRVPHLREVVWASYRWLLVRPGPLGAVTAVLAVALVWIVASHPGRTAGAIIADPLAQLLFVAIGVLLLVIVGRERILIRLDAWVIPENNEQRQVLAAAVAELTQTTRMATVSRTLNRAAARGCRSPAALLIAADTHGGAPAFRAPDSRVVPLPRASAIVQVLETAGGPLRVNPKDKTSAFPMLPPGDAAWVVETSAEVIVPLAGPGTEIFGMLVVGRRFDERVVHTVDLPFLEELGAAAGLAVAHLRQAQDSQPSEAPPAQECPVCNCVVDAGAPPECNCGAVYKVTDVPKLLAGKFRLTRRLGAGGMGAVYLARDLRLARDVAIKTPSRVSSARPMRLRPEA